MSLFTVTITGVSSPIEVYGGLTACKDRLGASSSAGAVAFNALASDDEKSKRLVDATRYLDSYAWTGAADAPGGTVLAWPRSGITDATGATLSDAAQLAIVNVCAFDLAGLIAADPDLVAAIDSGSNVKSLGAGPARLEFWRPQSLVDGNATILPTVVNRLMGRWLASATVTVAVSGSISGTDGCDYFDDDDTSDVKWPL